MRAEFGKASSAAGARAWVIVAGALLAALCVWYMLMHRVNSDEPQHLHVVWAWTRGLLPYRDVFDNHAPLFALLYSPLLKALGERTDIVMWMRLANLPWFALTVWLTFRLGRSLFNTQIGAAAAAVTAVQSTFFLKSIEFRPDVMWAALWVGAVAIAVEGRLTTRRIAAVGMLMGFASVTSIKTAVLLCAAGAALAMIVAIGWYSGRWRPDAGRLCGNGVAWLGGFMPVPLLIIVGFALAGALPAMRYCLVDHNLAAGLGRWSYSDALLMHLLPVLLLGPMIHLGYVLIDRGAWRGVAIKRAWVLLMAIGYFLLRDCYQPLIDGQDLLPWVPMLAPFVVAAIFVIARAVAPRRLRDTLPVAVIGTLVALEIAFVLVHAPFWRSGAQSYSDTLAQVLALSRPGDLVLDAKGGAIFRPRPTYWVFENVTLNRFARDSIRDDVAQRLAACHVAVVTGDRWPRQLARFIRANYLPTGDDVRVAGKSLGPVSAGQKLHFSVALPQEYTLRTDGDGFAGTLDGTRYTGARQLSGGPHTLSSERPGNLQLRWDGAANAACAPADFAHARNSIVR